MNSSTDHIMVSIQIYVDFKYVVKKYKANSDQLNLQNVSEMFLKGLCSPRHGTKKSLISVEKLKRETFNYY